MNTEPATPPLAIIGIGCLFPKAAGPGFYWANVKNGTDCITDVPPTHWDPDDYFDADPKAPDMTYARRGGFLSTVEFNPMEFGISPRDIEATDTSQLLGLVAAKQALTDAGVVLANPQSERRGDGSDHPPVRPPGSPRPIDRDRVSVILGVTGTLELVIPLGARLGHPRWKRAMREAGIPDDAVEDAAGRIADSYVSWQENSFPGLLGNVVAGRIANKLDLGGTNCVVDAACASSLGAIHLAALELQAGRTDVVVTGGVDTFNDVFMFMCFSKTPALSPTGDAKPFDAGGDGTILGEGLGVVVLKRLTDAERDGDAVYAVLRGIGSSSDGKGNAIYAPSAEGQKKCLRNAYALAAVSPDTIELVEAHGTGTRVGDTAEIAALTEVYTAAAHGSSTGATKPRPWCAIGSVKSQIGHTKAAAGAASLIKVVLSLHNKVLPPTLKVTQPVEPLRSPDSPFYINAKMRPWLPRTEHPRRAALSAFGFGGSNFHAVLEEYRSAKSEPDWDGTVEVVALAADTVEDLLAELGTIPVDGWDAFARFAEASRTSFRSGAPFRLAFAAHRDHTNLAKLISGATARIKSDPSAPFWHTPEGVHYGTGPQVGKLAVLFPGQGSQYVGMLRDLACLFPAALDSLAAADAAVAAATNEEFDARRLSDRIYPPTTFDPDAQEANDRDLRDTRYAQPAIGAVSFGAWQVLHERFGVTADAFAGHSYGELVALAAAGWVDPTSLFTLSHLRGQLMARKSDGDRGSMLAVSAPPADIESLLRDHNLDLVVANQNAPRQTVLSGATAEIARAEAAFATAGLSCTRLPVSAAFHSAFVADATGPFRVALDSVEWGVLKAPVFANTTAAEYPADTVAAKELLANQLAKPVEFAAQVRAMAAAGVRTFVEVGPGTVLTRLVEAVLADEGVDGAEAFALDSSKGNRPGLLDLGSMIARLAARGSTVRVAGWEQGSRCRSPVTLTPPSGLTIPICGANYVHTRGPRPPRSTNLTPYPNGQPHAAMARGTKVEPMSEPSTSGPTDPTAFTQAMQTTQQSLVALQRMQEQTAQLHRQFLESQEAAQRTLQVLVEQQHALLASSLGITPAVRLPPPPPVSSSTAVVPVSPPDSVSVPVPSPVPSNNRAPKQRELDREQVEATLLAVVAEKTGYPVGSLDLKLSLDADLGVDSIKRVEILSALQDRLPGAPQAKPEHLGTLHTLQDVADFLLTGEETTAARIPPNRQEPDMPASTPPGVDVASVLLAVVAEKTGYPVGSLDLKLSLDADLGVDSIKRVEILSALQDRLPGAPQAKPEHLGTLHTLQDVADFLRGQASRPEAPATTKIPVVPDYSGSEQSSRVPELTAQDTEQVSAIRPPKVSDSVLAYGRRSGGVAVPSRPQTGSDQGRLRSAADTARYSAATAVIDRIDRSILRPADLDPATPRPPLSLPTGGEIWIIGCSDGLTEQVAAEFSRNGFNPRVMSWSRPTVNIPGDSLTGLILLAPAIPDPTFELNRLGFEWIQQAGPRLRHAGRLSATVFATVARLDGAFGLNNLAPDTDPASGGLAGLVKTVRNEWPEVATKAIDLDPGFVDPATAAVAVVDEVLAAGPGEVGIAATHRCALEVARAVRRATSQVVGLGTTDVILVTGGARGVTAEAAVALAQTYGSTLILTGRTPLPNSEPDWLTGLTGEVEIKQAIADRIGPGAGPRQIGEQYQQLMAQHEVRRTLQRVEEAGAKVAYFSVDVSDRQAVDDLLHKVRVTFGPITALIHGAGVLADKRIEDLTVEEFDRVYRTKVDGLRHLLDLLPHEDLKALVLFSSVTARVGRTGQLAYAVANEVLNKTAQVEARRRPGCRVVSINWGPWEGGMVTPALRKQFESEGVGLISLADGATFMVNELTAAGKAVEVLALGKPPSVGSGVYSLPSRSGVIPPPQTVGGSGVSQHRSGLVSPPSPTPNAKLSLAFERTVDIESHPVLKSHVLDGRAVLPMALHLELLAHAALHGHPGLVFHGFNDLRITQGVQLDASEGVPLRAFAGKAVKQDKLFLVPVELRGRRKDGREAIKSRAEIVLVAALPKEPPADRPPVVAPYPFSIEQVYREFLFHGPDLHGIEAVSGVSDMAIEGTANPAPPPTEWFQSPLRSGWVADPLVLDASFQLMILWSRQQHGAASLPNFAGRYRQFRRSFPAGQVLVVSRVTRDNGTFARADIDYLDADGHLVAQMQDYECLIEKALNQAFVRNRLGAVKT